MNGMEKITARMKEDAARSLSKLNAQTEQELRRIREESAARAEKERETAGERAHLAAQERYERLCSAAEMETRKLTLSAKQKVLAETYDRALEILCSMPREQYLSLLVRLLSAKDRDEIGETLVERANKELNAHYMLAASAADIRAGFVLISKECDVNCSFETLLALSREKTERGAAKLLFAE